MNNSLSIFARALATENISFAFDQNAETASFDVKNRHLTLPVWDVSETVQTMLIAHEISHALWTPYERSEAILNDAEKQGYNRALLQRIANVVEDVRIEKMMKAKFPGTRRDFFLGYKEIVDADLFKFKGKDWKDANLATRINIFCKWGMPGFIDINLTDKEMAFVADIDRAQTIDDVYEVAKRIYEDEGMMSTRQEAQKSMSKGKSDNGAKSNPGDMIEGDMDGISKKDGETYNAASIVLTGLKDYKKAIVSTETLLARLVQGNTYAPSPIEPYRQFVKESDAFVRQMVAQFERRKAADEIRRERPKQTGMLNLDRLHQYRTHDDIFISKIVKQDGKNHGIVFLLDMSGSMQGSIKDCFLQILQLVWFCEKAKIPFEVFGFTDVHPCAVYPDYAARLEAHNRTNKSGNPFTHETMRDCPNMMTYEHATLINLASSRDSEDTREQLLAYLHAAMVEGTHSSSDLLRLHGTPTVESVAIVTQFMQKWVAEKNIQIPTIMIVTDGQPNGVNVSDYKTAQLYMSHTESGSLTVMNEMTGTAHRIELVEMKGMDIPNIILKTMLDSLRTTLNARCVGMFVGGAGNLHESNYIHFCMSRNERETYFHLPYHNRPDLTKTSRYAAAKEAYAEGAIVAHPDTCPGYDAYFLIRTPKIVKDEDATKVAGNFTKVKNAFVKTMAKRGCSRVFLTRYVDIVAGQPLHKKGDAIYNHPAH